MMMNNFSKNPFKLAHGRQITGKWNKNTYTIIKELGQGANGTVYLAENGGRKAALKLSENGSSIISEMNVLKAFSKVQGSALGPSLLEADDWVQNSGIISFYAMEYIEGESYLAFIKRKGPEWTGVLMLQLLTSLISLHKQGWVFGDLKPENLIVTMPSCTVRCIDVGGTTLNGRAIKEFTEFFDRGYWGLGSRKADPAYDLFAVAMIFINSFYPGRFPKKGEGYSQLMNAIKQKKALLPYKGVLDKALTGKYKTAEEMRADLAGILQKKGAGPAGRKTAAPQPAAAKSRRVQRKRVKKKRGGMLETLLLLCLVSLLYFLYLYGQVL